MDFSHLAGLQTQQMQLQADRKLQAEHYVQQGLQALALAVERDFRDKAALEAAHSHLIKAIQYDRTHLQPYLGVAHLRLILGDRDTALKYARLALKLAPEDEQAHALMLQLLHPPVAADRSLQADARSERFEQTLAQSLRRLAQQPCPATPLLDGEALDRLASHVSAGRRQLEHLQSELDALETELEAGELRRRLLPFETRLDRYQAVLKLSQAYQQFLTELQTAQTQVRRLLRQMQTAPTNPDGEARLDDLFDLCDRFADRLDEWATQGHPIDALKTPYKQLTAWVEAYRDALDELD